MIEWVFRAFPGAVFPPSLDGYSINWVVLGSVIILKQFEIEHVLSFAFHFLIFTLGFRRNRCWSIIWLIEGNSSEEKYSTFICVFVRS